MADRQWVLAAHAGAEVTAEQWELVEVARPVPGPDQILVRTRWLSVDPYMRGRLSAGSGLQVGDLMIGAGIGEVVESNHSAWKIGDLAETEELGWREYAVLTPDSAGGVSTVGKVDESIEEPQSVLSWLGMAGLTAYFAMMEVARPRPGDTVVVSGAAGGVGQIAGQIAAFAGADVVGIAGSDEKLEWCRKIGFHATANYKTSPDLTAEVGRLCQDGVNVFFDGTGGSVHDAVMANLAPRARVAIVGRIATADNAGKDIGLRASSKLIQTRAVVEGFVVYDWWDRRDEARRQLRKWYADGRLHFREDIAEGLENVPHAFIRMMQGDNLGKQLVAL